MEKIFVRNTRENLTILEEILDAMDVANLSADVEQVEIEAKFIEVSEGALEELGFKWFANGDQIGLLGDDDIIINTDEAVGTEHNSGLFDDALRSVPFTQSGLLGAGTAAATGNWSTFLFENTFNSSADSLELVHSGSTPVDIVINALDQTTGADVLSAPRVVTKSGEEAVIRVGEKHMYPEVYEPGASGGNIVHVQYEDWEEKLLGVELSVTPQLDGDQIEMELNPSILELQGWQTYDIASANSSYTWYQYRIGLVFDHAAIQAQLPIFRKRTFETEVTIADGATIGMGGLINEKVEAFEDKVPLLGSMPLVGRLFRSEGERVIKRNLMMFVTAKRVEPTGRISSARSFE
jgi:general secretion pathway protein D